MTSSDCVTHKWAFNHYSVKCNAPFVRVNNIIWVHLHKRKWGFGKSVFHLKELTCFWTSWDVHNCIKWCICLLWSCTCSSQSSCMQFVVATLHWAGQRGRGSACCNVSCSSKPMILEFVCALQSAVRVSVLAVSLWASSGSCMFLWMEAVGL